MFDDRRIIRSNRFIALRKRELPRDNAQLHGSPKLFESGTVESGRQYTRNSSHWASTLERFLRFDKSGHDDVNQTSRVSHLQSRLLVCLNGIWIVTSSPGARRQSSGNNSSHSSLIWVQVAAFGVFDVFRLSCLDTGLAHFDDRAEACEFATFGNLTPACTFRTSCPG
jgi:hypothetical protein